MTVATTTIEDIRQTYERFKPERCQICAIQSPIAGKRRLQMLEPSVMVVADIGTLHFDAYANAPSAIHHLLDEVDSLARSKESLEKELKYHEKVHKDAEKKLLRKLADAQSKQSATDGKADEGSDTKVHAKRKSGKRSGNSDE